MRNREHTSLRCIKFFELRNVAADQGAGWAPKDTLFEVRQRGCCYKGRDDEKRKEGGKLHDFIILDVGWEGLEWKRKDEDGVDGDEVGLLYACHCCTVVRRKTIRV